MAKKTETNSKRFTFEQLVEKLYRRIRKDNPEFKGFQDTTFAAMAMAFNIFTLLEAEKKESGEISLDEIILIPNNNAEQAFSLPLNYGSVVSDEQEEQSQEPVDGDGNKDEEPSDNSGSGDGLQSDAGIEAGTESGDK